MNRIDGYLDIDNYYEEKYGTSDLDSLIELGVLKESSYSPYHYWLTLDDGTYYFKDSGFSFREVICSYIAKDLGLNASSYHLAEFYSDRGVISKDYKKSNKKYITLEEIIINFCNKYPEIIKEMGYNEKIVPTDSEHNNLELIWMALDAYFPYEVEKVEKLMRQIIDVFIFKFLVRNSDSMPYNIEIEYSEDDINLAPIFDNEYSLWEEQNVFSMGVSYNSSKKYSAVLEKFLTISSSEFIDRFLEMYSLFTPEYIYELIERLEKEEDYKLKSHNKEVIINGYNKSIEVVESVLKKLNINHKRS